MTENQPVALDHVAEEIAETPLEDLEASPGVVEAIELYEASMKVYVTASSQYPRVERVSSTSLTHSV